MGALPEVSSHVARGEVVKGTINFIRWATTIEVARGKSDYATLKRE